MKLKDAFELKLGQKKVEDLDESPTCAEAMQLMMDACLLDDGNIWCLACNLPNECCRCCGEGN